MNRIAWVPVLVVAALTTAALLYSSAHYGHGFDELYFIVAGQDHLAWGYFDQPPLVPFLAGLLDSWFPGSLVMLRLPVTLAAAGGVVVTALIARELGGGRAAQVTAAATYAASGAVVISHWIATYTLDPFLWTVLTWLVVRWVRTRDDRLLLWAGVVTAVSLQVKFLVPAFWGLVLLSALVLGPRSLPSRPKLWLGAGIAVSATVPTLVWQAAHDWPYLNMSEVVAAEFPGAWPFLRDGVLLAGIGVGALAFVFGVFRLLFLAEYRFLGVAVLGLVAAFLLASGRSYYLLGVFALPFAVTAVTLWQRPGVRWRPFAVWPPYLLSGAAALAMLPIYPPSFVDKVPTSWGPFVLGSSFAAGERPQGELGRIGASVFASLPPDQRAKTAVFSDLYPFAASVEYFGTSRVYSGHRGYWYFGAPPDTAENVLFVGLDPSRLRPHFASEVALTDGLVWLLEGRQAPWPALWPALKTQ
ncbi:ArnT family glycosyltransferase [Amycolatopsis magusensis]|uniref:ArnT family glycosyltransferase n=1 Tax=Amycolatopsis magusensis TaxID=882444 RepID=UPI0024A9BE17|nr:glycosyltransferase family 39 protein [Amycolatopsis magusensis]MDI5981337.1 glycosyltransferase family 39 protein [Amycolatopsis magusensis]